MNSYFKAASIALTLASCVFLPKAMAAPVELASTESLTSIRVQAEETTISKIMPISKGGLMRLMPISKGGLMRVMPISKGGLMR